ncbi:type VI secretion system baseplate subunit TssG [Azoarcus sp. KH32C]|uniref:type VI secretion system baseplate subunit TssG n=1 Tax=Azoarcus sp. KH32C TaxID=748247 RepID=UPI0002386272|nr:type VI secretion system baseplate subunit TssG [Azoarcus sp. KH32C]BAL24076.1 hypothetical protein AZKH_1763 [Azoarcus sp. KH32C]
MRPTYRRIDPGLIEQLASAPQRFEFFQAVRLLERVFAAREGRLPRERPLESIRFRNSTALAFAPSQIEAVECHRRVDAEGQESGELERIEITPSFIGMLGIHGTLPSHYTERVADRERFHKDRAARAFFDLFSNRAVGNFYRAWKKYRLPVAYEQDRRQSFLPMVLALAGLGFDALRDRFQSDSGGVDDEVIAHFAGVLRQRPLSAAVLQDVLAGYFRVPLRVEQFVGKWYALPLDQRSTLGGTNAALGASMLLGERVWQRSLRIRIWIGPLADDMHAQFLPRGERAAALEKLLSLSTGHHFEYEIRPILHADHVRPARLGGGMRLGFDSFILTRPADTDRDDPMFESHPVH